MPSIFIDSCDDLLYGPGSTDYEYDKWRQKQMDEKMTAAEQAFEEWFKWAYPSLPIPLVYTAESVAFLAGYARATERTARRCMEICKQRELHATADVIAKEFDL